MDFRNIHYSDFGPTQPEHSTHQPVPEGDLFDALSTLDSIQFSDLLSKKCKGLNSNELNELFFKRDKEGRTLLHAAVQQNNVKSIRAIFFVQFTYRDKVSLLKLLGDKDSSGQTTLESAALSSNPEVFDAILYGAKGNLSILNYAPFLWGYIQFLIMLIKKNEMGKSVLDLLPDNQKMIQELKFNSENEIDIYLKDKLMEMIGKCDPERAKQLLASLNPQASCPFMQGVESAQTEQPDLVEQSTFQFFQQDKFELKDWFTRRLHERCLIPTSQFAAHQKLSETSEGKPRTWCKVKGDIIIADPAIASEILKERRGGSSFSGGNFFDKITELLGTKALITTGDEKEHEDLRNVATQGGEGRFGFLSVCRHTNEIAAIANKLCRNCMGQTLGSGDSRILSYVISVLSKVIYDVDLETAEFEIAIHECLNHGKGLSEQMKKMGFSEEHITVMVKQTFVIGKDTTPTLLENAIYWLTKHPNYQEEIFLEISQLWDGESELTHQTLGKMTLLRKFLDEVLRISAPVITQPRVAMQDKVIGDLEIKQGDLILISQYLGNRDPARWENPEEFNPNRDLKEQQNYLPFSTGPNRCLGKFVARQMVLVALASLIRHCKLTQTETEPAFKEGELYKIQGLNVKVQPHAYP